MALCVASAAARASTGGAQGLRLRWQAARPSPLAPLLACPPFARALRAQPAPSSKRAAGGSLQPASSHAAAATPQPPPAAGEQGLSQQQQQQPLLPPWAARLAQAAGAAALFLAWYGLSTALAGPFASVGMAAAQPASEGGHHLRMFGTHWPHACGPRHACVRPWA